MNTDNKSPAMHRKLKNRHMQMIALGAAVGTGLFYGSAPTIQLVGPGIILSYLLTGIFIFFVMRMLGEMTVREPVSASFSHFAGKYWHPFMGYLSGWNYWTLYMLAGMAELAAIAVYMNYWFPSLPQWLSTLICIVIITGINLSTVRAYGEAEFWASFIKIGAIVAMIIFGFYLIFATMGAFPQNFSNLWTNGGFFPNGGWGFLCSLAIVVSGIVINWAVIIITHLKFRARFQQENRMEELHFKAFGYPILNYLSLLYLLGMVVVMWFMDSMRISVIAIPVWIIFLYITYKLKPKTNLPTPPVK